MKYPPKWRLKLAELAEKYQLSEHAAAVLLQALMKGRGEMAQFEHPELGGAGQWMPGGMTMISDMSNTRLKLVIDELCTELASLLKDNNLKLIKEQENIVDDKSSQRQTQYNDVKHGLEPLFKQNSWWPDELGEPAFSGGQNDLLYAYFAHKKRLALKNKGEVFIYNTLHHRISGVSQQQSLSGQLLVFTSQEGVFAVSDLPHISSATQADPSSSFEEVKGQTNVVSKAEKLKEILSHTVAEIEPMAKTARSTPPSSKDEIFETLKKLAELKEQGVISEADFEDKKSDLLSRL